MTKPTADKTKAKATTQTPAEKPAFIGENLKFTITIPWKTVQEGYQKTLQTYAQEIELPGFRKGKAPLNKVEERVGKTKLYEETVSRVLSPAYAEEVRTKGYKPIVEPHVHPKAMEENKDWVFEIETAEYPEIKLGDYKEAVKSAKAKSSIIVPGKDEKKPEVNPEEAQLRTIFQALLEQNQVRVPEMMLHEEVNRSLSRLLQQLERLHVSLEDYLKSIQKTGEQLRQEFALNGLTTLQLEFILTEIAKAEKLEVSTQEIDAIIATIPDEKIRAASQSPYQRAVVASTLLRRKTIEWLQKL